MIDYSSPRKLIQIGKGKPARVRVQCVCWEDSQIFREVVTTVDPSWMLNPWIRGPAALPIPRDDCKWLGPASCISLKSSCKFLPGSYLHTWSEGLWRGTTMSGRFLCSPNSRAP